MLIMKNVVAWGLLLLVSGLGEEGSDSGEEKESKGQPLKIAYNMLYDREGDDYEVFVMNLDGSGKRNISNWKGVDWVYYAYEDKIYFISDRDTCHRCYFLYETDAEGKNIRKVVDFQLQDSWLSSRHNGTELIVDPHPKVDSVFRIIDLKGQIVGKVDPGLAYMNDPFFSPDGESVVFRGSEKKFKKDLGYIDELYVINVDGSGLRQLTTFPKEDTTIEWYNYHAGPPFWEPKRNVISYISKQNKNYSIFLINPDGSGQRQLTPDGFNEGWHAWSPDGEMIAYDGYDLKNTNFDIYLMDGDGKNVRRLTTDARLEQAPVFVKTRRGL